MLESRAQNISDSFLLLKKDPLNLNKLMTHVMLLSQLLDDMLREKASQLRAATNDNDGESATTKEK